MKKAIFAFAAVICLGLASCSSDCKCTTTVAGEVISTVTISEKTLQAANVTCAQYNEVLQMTAGMGTNASEYSIQCK